MDKLDKRFKELLQFSNNSLLMAIYLREILDKSGKKTNFYTKEELDDILLFRYLDKDTKLLNYDELCTYYKDTYRFSLLKDLLTREKLTLLDDAFLKNNYLKILEMLTFEIKASASFAKNTSDVSRKITDSEFTSLVEEYLKEIDPTLEWLNIYKEALANKKIIYLFSADKVEESDNKTFYLDGDVYSIILRDNTLKDFYYFAHEFTHFIQFKKNNTYSLSKSIDEFMAIFYEKYALDFLARKNYSEEYINTLKAKRGKNIFSLGMDIIQILIYLETLEINKDISFAEEQEKAKAMINYQLKNLDEKTLTNIKEKYPWQLEATSYVKKTCDDTLMTLISNYDVPLLNEYYPYIMGSFLANITLEEVRNKHLTLEELKALAENSLDIDLEKLFHLLNISLTDGKKTYQYH